MTNQNKIQTLGNKNYVFIVYILMPIVVTILLYFTLDNYLINYVSSINIGVASISNSEYTIQRIFKPFISSLLLIISLLIILFLIKIIESIYKNNKFNVAFAKQIILWVSISIALLSAISLFYSNADSFEYWKYGIENKETTNGYLPLVLIRSMRGGNLSSSSAPLLYQFIHFSANLIKGIADKLDLLIVMVSAILIPLVLKVEKYKEE